MSALITIWIFSVIIVLLVLGFRKLAGVGQPVPVVDPSIAPPNPGGFDARKLRTQAQKEAWLIAYCKRVNWERTQPRKPIPPPLNRMFDKSEVR